MSSYSQETILDKFRELHTRLQGSAREVSIAKVMRVGPTDPFSTAAPDYVTDWLVVDPPPIITDTPDIEMQQMVGTVARGVTMGRDEKMFVFLADSIVDRDPIDTLDERIDDMLLDLSGIGAGVIKYGNTLYSISTYYATSPLIGVTPQWVVIGRVMRNSG